jgi:hypothetical protein
MKSLFLFLADFAPLERSTWINKSPEVILSAFPVVFFTKKSKELAKIGVTICFRVDGLNSYL